MQLKINNLQAMKKIANDKLQKLSKEFSIIMHKYKTLIKQEEEQK